MKRIFGVALIAFSATNAFATENAFNGLSISASEGASINMDDVKSNYSYTNLFAAAADAAGTGGASYDNETEIDTTGSLNIAYGEDMGSKYNVQLVGSIAKDSTHSMDSNVYRFPNPNSRPDVITNYRVENEISPNYRLSVGVQPGYYFNEKLLGFVSLGYHYMDADIKTHTRGDFTAINADRVISDVSKSESFHGISIGGGAKYAITNNWFIGGSGELLYFGAKRVAGPNVTSVLEELTLRQSTSIQPITLNALLTIGYRF